MFLEGDGKWYSISIHVIYDLFINLWSIPHNTFVDIVFVDCLLTEHFVHFSYFDE